MIILTIILIGLLFYGGMKFLNVLTDFYKMMAESPEVRERRQREEAVRNNIRFYEESYERMMELLKETWYIKGIKMTHGGVIRAAYKKYPNVWMRIDLSYDEYLPNEGDLCLQPELYIDDTHHESCVFGLTLMTSGNEERRKKSLESFNRLVDMTVENYCLTNGINLPEKKFAFAFTDEDCREWRTGSLSLDDIDPGKRIQYAYTVKLGGEHWPCGTFPTCGVKTTIFDLNDKQRTILSAIK